LRNHHTTCFNPKGFGVTASSACRRRIQTSKGAETAKFEMQSTQLSRRAQLRRPTPSEPFGFAQKDFDVIATSAMKAEKSNNQETETAKAEM
jgi:hypothetical protein